MTTTTVFNVLDLPGGVHAAGQAVVVRLIGTGFVVGDRREIIWESWTETDAAGRWEFPLTPNSEIGDGTYYEVVEPGGRTWAFVAPTSADPVWLKDELTEDPQPGGPVVVGVKTVNGQSPDPSGNVDVSGGTGTVQTVAGVTPVAGDVQEAALVAALGGSFATPEQGALADSAVQPGDLAAVATSGAYGDLSGRPTLGTAAAANSGDFDPAGAASSAQSAAIGAASSDATTKANAAQAFAIQRGNHTGTQSADSVVDGTTNKVLTAADKTRLAGTSGSNTGDETAATIKSKLGITTLSGSNTGDQDLSALATKASPALTGVPTAPTAAPGTNTTQIATAAFVVDAVTTAVAGLYDLRGTYNASGNTFPAAGGSGAAGAVLKGDVWIISVAGTLGGVAVVAGDQVLALVDAPGQTAGNWSIYEHDLGYVPENVANKDAAGGYAGLDGGGKLKTAEFPAVGTAGTYGDATHTVTLTTDAQGRVTAVTTNLITGSSLTRQLKTANYNAALGEYVAADTTGGAFTVTLPAASGGKGTIVLKWVAGALAPSVAVTGSDHFDTSTGSTGGAFTLLNQAATYDSDGTSIWSVRNSFALSTLDARYQLKGFSSGVAMAVSGRWYAPDIGPYVDDNGADGLPSNYANGALWLMPFVPASDMPVNTFGLHVSVAGTAGSVIRPAIYNANQVTGLATTPFVDPGTVSGTAAADVTLGFTAATLKAGVLYLIGGVKQGAPATAPIIRAFKMATGFITRSTWGASFYANSSTVNTNTLNYSGITGALPDLTAVTPTFPANSQVFVPQIWVKVV